MDELSASLDELYELFNVAPVARRTMHNGTTPISVKGKRWQEQYDELWNLLVPGNRKAQTIQGEMLRIVGRVTYEILDNGGINWDDDYIEMLHTLNEFLKLNKRMETKLIEEATCITKHISTATDKKTLYRLAEIIVKWILANPKPIPLSDVSYKR